jgi:pimeloyl-ACP methyl ester carboxylesterase
VDVGGYRIWIQAAGAGSPTVVFESGGGDDSSVWSSVAAEVRGRRVVATVLYDRAGLGKSEPSPGPYRIDDESAALRSALEAVDVHGPFVLVAHSYGGFVSLLTAATDPRVAGLVLVDANMPRFFDDAEIARLLERFAPVIPRMESEAPQVAHVMVPLMRALPDTARRLRSLSLRPSLPVIDIVAERTWVSAPEEVEALRRAHAEFVAESPSREAVFARGCGHYVMHDRPEIVFEAVVKMIDRVRG